MTIYEQIQRSLDYIEDNLFHQIKQKSVAKEAGMSSRSFQHYFWMITGYSYKEYLIKRRLSSSLCCLESSKKQILKIALDVGYQSHESFSRAFKNEFKVSPKDFRQHMLCLNGLNRIELFKEKYMDVIIKELPELLAISFTGFSPEPENKAKAKMKEWLNTHEINKKPRRIFGHNVDLQGNYECNPENTGYKFLVSVDNLTEGDGEKIETIKAGNFFVTGIEGNFVDDPNGNFIKVGWERMKKMIMEKKYSVKKNGRWFEEELEPQKVGNLRLDLYLEIE